MAGLRSPLAVVSGCGAVGSLVAARLLDRGWRVIGVRRQPAPLPIGVRGWFGDAADDALLAGVTRAYGRPDAVALTANPGLRAGGDHHLDGIALRVTRHWPGARLVYTGSTAVYADSGGRWIDERGRLARGHRPERLRAIEAAVLAHGDALVLRAGALGGLARAERSARLRSGALRVRGSPARSLSWIHERDLAALVVHALADVAPQGVINAVAAEHPSVASFHRRSAAELGWHLTVSGDARSAPERRITSHRHAELLPAGWRWRPWWVR